MAVKVFKDCEVLPATFDITSVSEVGLRVAPAVALVKSIILSKRILTLVEHWTQSFADR